MAAVDGCPLPIVVGQPIVARDAPAGEAHPAHAHPVDEARGRIVRIVESRGALLCNERHRIETIDDLTLVTIAALGPTSSALRVGDVLLTVNGSSVENDAHATALIRDASRTVHLGVLRLEAPEIVMAPLRSRRRDVSKRRRCILYQQASAAAKEMGKAAAFVAAAPVMMVAVLVAPELAVGLGVKLTTSRR
eukprot:6161419-Prymnesium_polylepis.1